MANYKMGWDEVMGPKKEAAFEAWRRAKLDLEKAQKKWRQTPEGLKSTAQYKAAVARHTSLRNRFCAAQIAALAAADAAKSAIEYTA